MRMGKSILTTEMMNMSEALMKALIDWGKCTGTFSAYRH